MATSTQLHAFTDDASNAFSYPTLSQDPVNHSRLHRILIDADITKRVIRDMTGNKEYEFGDGYKAVSAATQQAAEKAAESVIDAGGSAIEAGAAAKKVLDDSGYQFGDLTKGAIKSWEEMCASALLPIRDSTSFALPPLLCS